MSPFDWDEFFTFSVSPLELIARGSVIYALLFLVFRLILRRDAGSIGIADVLFIVLIADASQNAMAGEYHTVADGVVLIATLVAWNTAIDRIAFAFPRMAKVLEPQPVLLVRNGTMLLANLRRERMSRAELMSKLREHGIEKVDEVKRARLEDDGEVSVIRRDGSDTERIRPKVR